MRGMKKIIKDTIEQKNDDAPYMTQMYTAKLTAKPIDFCEQWRTPANKIALRKHH
jgi:hypothetical protein